MEKMRIQVEGYEAIEKVVKPAGNTGRIYVPKGWEGKRVKIVLLEKTD
jgi:putative transposon-encoded protein